MWPVTWRTWWRHLHPHPHPDGCAGDEKSGDEGSGAGVGPIGSEVEIGIVIEFGIGTGTGTVAFVVDHLRVDIIGIGIMIGIVGIEVTIVATAVIVTVIGHDRLPLGRDGARTSIHSIDLRCTNHFAYIVDSSYTYTPRHVLHLQRDRSTWIQP